MEGRGFIEHCFSEASDRFDPAQSPGLGLCSLPKEEDPSLYCITANLR